MQNSAHYGRGSVTTVTSSPHVVSFSNQLSHADNIQLEVEAALSGSTVSQSLSALNETMYRAGIYIHP